MPLVGAPTCRRRPDSIGLTVDDADWLVVRGLRAAAVRRRANADGRYGAPRITKDGVTVAKEIELSDKFENMGAQMAVLP